MTITYVDDTTHETLKQDKLDGTSDQDAKYTTSDSIKHYTDLHYKLVSDSTNGKDLIFDHDDKNIAGDNGALYADDHGNESDAGHDRFGVALLYPAAAQDSDQSSDNHRDGVNNYSKHVDLPFSSSVFVF